MEEVKLSYQGSVSQHHKVPEGFNLSRRPFAVMTEQQPLFPQKNFILTKNTAKTSPPMYCRHNHRMNFDS